MELLGWLVIIAILIGYLNLALILFRERPVINIYNKLPDGVKYQAIPEDKKNYSYSGTAEIPIQSHVTVKDLNADINLNSEKVGTSDISELTNKIKKFRSK